MRNLPIRKRYRLHLTTGRTIEGVLTDARGAFWTLADPRVEVSGELVATDHTVIVERKNVEWMQLV